MYPPQKNLPLSYQFNTTNQILQNDINAKKKHEKKIPYLRQFPTCLWKVNTMWKNNWLLIII